MADTDRLEAKGPRGEACIIIRTWVAPTTPPSGDAAGGRGQPSYRLATGERLATTDDPAVFETLDRARRFTLRQP
ncbi:MAG: hypothetical protein IPG77_15565 [Betaproteobacteria bacterium]|jgi:hypothetical protein|nr:hypothetical protein [Betaproteobacteria bacterium]